MRILVAPDKFAGTLTAVQAAEAIARGWRATAPRDGLDTAPLSDGGPGFVDVIHAALGGRLLAVQVSGPLGGRVPATVLMAGAAGDAGGAGAAGDAGAGTAYVEAAQACGLDLVPADRRDPG
ncbi:MAG: glycerate kinase, partial [Streptomycetales bacterium]